MSASNTASNSNSSGGAPPIEVTDMAQSIIAGMCAKYGDSLIDVLSGAFGFDADAAREYVRGAPEVAMRAPKPKGAPKTPRAKAPKAKAADIPFHPERVREDRCACLVFNRGLFTQCPAAPETDTDICAACAESGADKSLGTVDVRTDLFWAGERYKDEAGRNEQPFVRVMGRRGPWDEEAWFAAEGAPAGVDRSELEVDARFAPRRPVKATKSETKPKSDPKPEPEPEPEIDAGDAFGEEYEFEDDVSVTEFAPEDEDYPDTDDENVRAEEEAAQAEAARVAAEAEAARAEAARAEAATKTTTKTKAGEPAAKKPRVMTNEQREAANAKRRAATKAKAAAAAAHAAHAEPELVLF